MSVVGAEVPPPPPPVSLLPSWEPVTLEALEDAEENAEEGDADVAPSRLRTVVGSDLILVEVDQDVRGGPC